MKKINYKAIESFSNRITEAISYNYFLHNEKATGKDVMTASPVKQFNLFVLKNIFLEWQTETDKYKSDYFDFEHEDVKKALKGFMETVSFHISLNQDAFSALFHDAVLDTFSLVLSPEKYFKNLIKESKTVEKLKENQRYFVYNKVIVGNIISAWEKAANIDEVFSQLNTIIKDTKETFEPSLFMKDVSQIIPTNTADFILEDYLEEQKPVEVPKEESKVATEKETEKEEPYSTNEESVQKTETKQEQAVVEEEKTPEPVISETLGEDPVNTEEVKEEIEEPASLEKPINTKTFNDTFAPDTAKKTLYDELQHQNKETKKFKNCITLSQKYIFIKELFGGTMDVYDKAVEDVDAFKSYEEASNFLIYNYADKYNWQSKEEQSAELFEALSLKF